MPAPTHFHKLSLVFALSVAGLSACADLGARITPTSDPTPFADDPTPSPTLDLEPTSAMIGNVSIWMTWKPEGIRGFNRLIAEFQERHPGATFALSYVPEGEIRDRLTEAHSVGELPSLILAPSLWASELYEAGMTQDLSGRRTEELRVLVHPLAWSQAISQGSVLGIPLQMHGNVLYRNRQLAPVPAATVAGLVEGAQAFRGTANVGLAQDLGFQISAPFALACGGRLMQSNSEPDLESPTAACWLQLLENLGPAGPIEFGSDVDRERFRAGEAAWLVESTEHFEDLSESLAQGALTVDPWPVYQETGEQLAGHVWTENVYFAADLAPEDLELAWDFVTFLLSADSQISLADPNGAGNIPVHIAAPTVPGHVGQMHAALLSGMELPTEAVREEYVKILEFAARAVAVQGMAIDLALQRAQEQLAEVPDV